MDPERWPDMVRVIVDQIGAASGSEVAVDVQQLITNPGGQHYGWLITAPSLMTRFQLLGHEPRPATQPIPLPAWVAKLNDLPPGGTT